MRLKQFFAPVKSISPDGFKAFLKQQAEGTYNLLDVRQPKEYEAVHIPGAVLKPLPELDKSLSGIDSQKPTVVYCAVGGRSRVAAQLLSGKGFKTVYNLKGGIKAWGGEKVAGPKEMNLEIITGAETPSQMMAIAYEMEAGLGTFYKTAKDKATDPELIELLLSLIQFEESHRKIIATLYSRLHPEGENITESIKDELQGIMEGGFPVDRFLSDNQPFIKETGALLQLAMMVEAQALDFYLRFAEKMKREDTRNVLYQIASEERKHLTVVGRLFDRKLSARP